MAGAGIQLGYCGARSNDQGSDLGTVPSGPTELDNGRHDFEWTQGRPCRRASTRVEGQSYAMPWGSRATSGWRAGAGGHPSMDVDAACVESDAKRREGLGR